MQSAVDQKNKYLSVIDYILAKTDSKFVEIDVADDEDVHPEFEVRCSYLFSTLVQEANFLTGTSAG